MHKINEFLIHKAENLTKELAKKAVAYKKIHFKSCNKNESKK